MTQKQDIFNFLNERSPKGFTSDKIFKKFNFPFPSVRGRLSELKKSGEIESRKSKFLKRLVYFVPEGEIFYRKIVKSTVYNLKDPHRKGAPTIKKFALTYEDNTINREEELLDELDDGKTFHEYGYDDQLETKNPPFVFPTIEVGEE